ncbi:hypothetical protein [Microlunatus flavus]|uniref:Capsular polysaccharide biosynthesis protein n=1 Tax=Microlunatus flavus TaxID=1036181 RepID=A0A1H9DGE8_9ACTN|nr:hypothetical protein [Microlunatus flavus]SEQ12560.1 hypothetical protein SAMN05421756_102534 [Microlunatus flavus]
MQVQDFILAIRRRWYLALAALVLSVVATVAALALVGPTYEAKGTTLLVPPGATLQQQRPGEAVSTGNPYLELSGLGQARDIVIRSMTSQSTFLALCSATGDAKYLAMRDSLCQSHPKVKYTVTPDYESSAPVIMVTIEANSQQDAITALGAVMNQVPASLRSLQGSLNLRARADITSTPVTADVVPVVVRKNQIRAGILVGGGSLALFLLAIGLLDSLLLSRGTRPERPVAASGPAQEAEEADAGWGWTDDDAAAGTPVAAEPTVEEADGWGSIGPEVEQSDDPRAPGGKVPQPTSAGWG